MRNTKITVFAALFALLASSCGIYSLNGGVIDSQVETVSVELFENNASIVVPTLAQNLTETLKDKFVGQSRLRLVNYDGHMAFSGAITRYSVSPVAIQGNETAADNRLTITVKVTYKNEINPEDDWDNSFTQFADFPSTQNLSDVEDELITDILERLTQDIFNKALSNW